MKLTDIYIYPVKSLGAIRLESSKIEARGLQYDRRWMVVDKKGVFLTQRKYPSMALIQPLIHNNTLILINKKKPSNKIAFPVDSYSNQTISVTVWKDTCKANIVNESVSKWLSDYLGQPVDLVYMPDTSIRKADEEFAKNDDIVSFADGFPVLIIGEAAINHLNTKLEESISVLRFRPNLVFSGGLPHEEDTMAQVQIGNAKFYGVKPCSRCNVPTIDPATGIKGREPNPTLATYRKTGHKVLFGENLIADSNSIGLDLSIGDELKILERKAPMIEL